MRMQCHRSVELFSSLFIQMFIFRNVTITVPEKFTQCTTHGSFVQRWQETLYNMFTFVCLFLLPLAIMIFCYTRILIEISSRMARNNCECLLLFFRRLQKTVVKKKVDLNYSVIF